MKTTNLKTLILATLCLMAVSAPIVYSHCQMPCGIYGDPSRFDMIAEHITTIEKSVKQLAELSKHDKPNMNQITRWVNNKEKHADKLSHIVTYYFMAQRIKLVDKSQGKAYEDYIKKLTLLHEILVYSMKARQTAELSNVEKLRTLLTEFRAAYFRDDDTHEH